MIPENKYRDGSEQEFRAGPGMVSASEPITILMNPKLSGGGITAFVLEDLAQYKKPIYASDYENYIQQSKLVYEGTEDISQGMLYDLKMNGVEILICVCIYNEPTKAIQITMEGIYANLPHLAAFGIPQDKIAVALIQDGILNCHESVVQRYAKFDGGVKSTLKERMDVIQYQIEAAKKKGKSSGVQKNQNFPETIPKRLSLLYQNKWTPENETLQKPGVKLNLLTCFKHKNGKKLSSHVWFFEGFCRYLKPTYCILLDVGTVPDQKGVLNLIKGMIYDDRIGGVSGFMSIDSNFESLEGDAATPANTNNNQHEESRGLLRENQNRRQQYVGRPPAAPLPKEYQLSPVPAQANRGVVQDNQEGTPSCFSEALISFFCSVEKAQEVEYISAHFLDKNFQSFTRFLHVLPGAWSGYRLAALQTNETYNLDILQKKYFKTIFNPHVEEGEEAYKEANMYLAEDRILSLAIYCQPRQQYYLKYIPNAKAKTDPMKDHANLITQRRRWINSSLFAFEYVLANYSYDMRDSRHGVIDTIMINIGMVIATIGAVNAYLIPCFYLFVLYAILRTNDTLKYIQDTYNLGTGQYLQTYVALLFSLIYVGTVLVAIGGSLNGNRWIKEIYQYDQNGEVIKDPKGNPIPQKKTINGPALHVSRILAFFTYFLLLLISQIVVRTIIKFVNRTQDIPSQWLVFILLVVNAAAKTLNLLMHLPTHPKEVFAYLWGWVSYVSYQGVYTHTMVIFSFCNVDDVSWGTKGATDDSGEKKFSIKKMYFVSKWLFWNMSICFILFLLQFVLYQDGAIRDIYVLLALAVYSTIEHIIKTVFALFNHIRFYMCCCCGKRELDEDDLKAMRESRNQKRSFEMVEVDRSPDRSPVRRGSNEGTATRLKSGQDSTGNRKSRK